MVVYKLKVWQPQGSFDQVSSLQTYIREVAASYFYQKIDNTDSHSSYFSCVLTGKLPKISHHHHNLRGINLLALSNLKFSRSRLSCPLTDSFLITILSSTSASLQCLPTVRRHQTQLFIRSLNTGQNKQHFIPSWSDVYALQDIAHT